MGSKNHFVFLLGLVFLGSMSVTERIPFPCRSVAGELCYLCHVRIVAVILSIYLMGLNSIPCGDSVHMDGNSRSVVLLDAAGGHDHGCEQCSPFCQCHCCHSHTVVLDILGFEPLTLSISQENYIHLDSNYFSYLDSRFQPPRV